MFNYKMKIAYDGTQYHGWQIQPNGISIQELIQNAAKIILHEEIHVIGSGRTDSGVHAKGQIAHFKTTEPVNAFRFMGSLNGLLPDDIRILTIESAHLNFHAQHDAIGKIYHYHLHLDRILDPFKKLYSWHVREKLDCSLLLEASSFFIGTHDFSSFANEAHKGCAAYDATRTIKRLDIIFEEGGVRLEFEGNGFLYKMVRNIVGTLIEVATGKREVKDLARVLQAKDRKQAGNAAPPQGLFLMEVLYTPTT